MPRDASRPTSAISPRRLPPRLLPRLRSLGEREQLQVCCFMSELVNGERTAALIEQARRPHLACPRCRGADLHRSGHANGLQRFRCKNCARSFNALTGTPLARLRLKNRWLAYFDCMRDPGCTAHSAAQRVGVHASTSFRWRHRFLDWAKLDRPGRLQGVAEVGSTFFAESQKGTRRLARPARQRGQSQSQLQRRTLAQVVEVTFARERGGHTIDVVAGGGLSSAAALREQLLPRLAPDLLMVGAGDSPCRDVAREAGIVYRRQSDGADGRRNPVCHTRNVRAYLDRFRHWLAHFNGVATRYLRNYLGWRWAIDRSRIRDAAGFLRAALGIFTS